MGGGAPAGSRDGHGMQHGMSAMKWKERTEVRAKVCGVPRCRGVLRASPQ